MQTHLSVLIFYKHALNTVFGMIYFLQLIMNNNSIGYILKFVIPNQEVIFLIYLFFYL